MAFTGLTVGATPTATGAAFVGDQIFSVSKASSLGLAAGLEAQVTEYVDGSNPLKTAVADAFAKSSRPSGASYLWAGGVVGADEKLVAGKRTGYQMMALTIPGADTVISGGVVEKMREILRRNPDFPGKDNVRGALSGTVKLGDPIKALCDCLAVVGSIDKLVGVTDIFNDWMEINYGVLSAVKGALATMDPRESLDDNSTLMFLALNHHLSAWERISEDLSRGTRTSFCINIISLYTLREATPDPKIAAIIRGWWDSRRRV